jgi:hypothetical protein
LGSHYRSPGLRLPVPVPARVAEGIALVRARGVNLLRSGSVAFIAGNLGYPEVGPWIEADPRRYARLLAADGAALPLPPPTTLALAAAVAAFLEALDFWGPSDNDGPADRVRVLLLVAPDSPLRTAAAEALDVFDDPDGAPDSTWSGRWWHAQEKLRAVLAETPLSTKGGGK